MRFGVDAGWPIRKLILSFSACKRIAPSITRRQSISFEKMPENKRFGRFATSENPSPIILPRELLVFDALRHHAVFAEPPLLVFLVVLEVAFEPFDVAVAFEGEDMRGEAVEEHAVVADDHRAAGEIL